MKRRRFVARKRNQAEARVVAAQARCGADAVKPRHVQIDNDGVGVERLRELDCLQAVGGGSDHHELRLPVDQFLKGVEEGPVVVRDEDADPRLLGGGVVHDGQR